MKYLFFIIFFITTSLLNNVNVLCSSITNQSPRSHQYDTEYTDKSSTCSETESCVNTDDKTQLSRLTFEILDGIQTILTMYAENLNNYPLFNKIFTAGIIGVLGDILSQYFESIYYTNAPFDYRRNFGVFLEEFFVSGPLMHYSYDFYESILPIADHKDDGIIGTLMAILQVMIDLLIMDPMYVLSAMVICGLLEGFSLTKDIIPQMKTELFPSIKAAWTSSFMLSPIQFLSFRFLPVNWRVLPMTFQNILWNAVVFYTTHRGRGDSNPATKKHN